MWKPIEEAPKNIPFLDLWVVATYYNGTQDAFRSVDCHWNEKQGWLNQRGTPVEYEGVTKVTHFMKVNPPE